MVARGWWGWMAGKALDWTGKSAIHWRIRGCPAGGNGGGGREQPSLAGQTVPFAVEFPVGGFGGGKFGYSDDIVRQDQLGKKIPHDGAQASPDFITNDGIADASGGGEPGMGGGGVRTGPGGQDEAATTP